MVGDEIKYQKTDIQRSGWRKPGPINYGTLRF
jgi:hypothetical protein